MLAAGPQSPAGWRSGSRGGSLGLNEPPFLLIHSTYWFFVTPSRVQHSALACQFSLATVYLLRAIQFNVHAVQFFYLVQLTKASFN